MSAPRLEVAEVFKSCQEEYLREHAVSREQRKALSDILACRTAALGGHLLRCDECSYQEIAYNSCRNRHCSKCQAARQADWCFEQAQNLLDVPYCHVVFTLPEGLSPLALQNQRLVYQLLFRAASQTLLTIARDERHLGARIGFVAVLHTWGQTLTHHPHLHCLVPAGGLAPDRDSWISCKKGFFLPVRVLSALYQGKFLSFLRQARRDQALEFHGKLTELAREGSWRRFLEDLKAANWVVYAKPPFGSPEQVVKYLSRYTHRVAIHNARLISLRDGQVSFSYKDYRQGDKRLTMTLSATEFTRRFLLHVLPKGFVRIRHYGFLANRVRQEQLTTCRKLLGESPLKALVAESQAEDQTSPHPMACPACNQGRLSPIRTLPPWLLLIEPRMNSPDKAAA